MRRPNKKRKLTSIGIVAVIAIAIFVLAVSFKEEQPITGNNVAQPNQSLLEMKPRLGYCPTMHPYALNINKDDEFELVLLGSASEVLKELSEGSINYALIGRKARTNEVIPGVNEIKLMEGYTLITEMQRTIMKEELQSIEIHTHVDAEITSVLFGEEQKIVFHETLEEAKGQGIGKAVLINWEKYNDDDLLVVYDGLKKDLRFRTPRIYHY